MSPLAIIETCELAGVTLSLDDGRLVYEGPGDEVAGLLPLLRANKLRLIDWLERTESLVFTQPDQRPFCNAHEEQLIWQSIYGPHFICEVCHPPATPAIVAVSYPPDSVSHH